MPRLRLTTPPARQCLSALALAVVAAFATACDDSAESAAAPPGASGDAAPSRQAASICEKMVRDGVEEIVGEQLVDAPRAVHEGTRYSCRYTFAPTALSC